MEVFQTLRDNQIGNGNILQFVEQQNHVNQQTMQNLVQLQDQMQQVYFVVKREG